MTKCYRNVVEKDRNRPSVHQRVRGRATAVQPYDGTSLGCEKERRTNVTDLENVTLRGARHKRPQSAGRHGDAPSGASQSADGTEGARAWGEGRRGLPRGAGFLLGGDGNVLFIYFQLGLTVDIISC